MGCLVLYPIVSAAVPTEDQVAEALRLLQQESVLDRERWPGTWCSGPAWERLGIQTESQPSLLTVRRLPRAVSAPWRAPVRDQVLSRQRFYLAVRDCRRPGVSWKDPLWRDVQERLGTDLLFIYLPV